VLDRRCVSLVPLQPECPSVRLELLLEYRESGVTDIETDMAEVTVLPPHVSIQTRQKYIACDIHWHRGAGALGNRKNLFSQ
jgi:hypothetical protein